MGTNGEIHVFDIAWVGEFHPNATIAITVVNFEYCVSPLAYVCMPPGASTQIAAHPSAPICWMNLQCNGISARILVETLASLTRESRSRHCSAMCMPA